MTKHDYIVCICIFYGLKFRLKDVTYGAKEFLFPLANLILALLWDFEQKSFLHRNSMEGAIWCRMLVEALFLSEYFPPILSPTKSLFIEIMTHVWIPIPALETGPRQRARMQLVCATHGS